ncbi:MAG: hypothetical protein AB8F95_15920 [Bacteroidia bacterium]
MNTLIKIIAGFAFILLCTNSVIAQLSLGLEFQAYPTGIIPGLRLATDIGDRGEANLRLGYQIIDHQDFGVQDDETGSGVGATLGYRHFFKDARKGFFAGIRTDLWFNSIDYISLLGTPAERRGTSNIVVLQPTLEGGYRFNLGEQFSLTPALGFGVEWNIATNGEPTGQGPIVLGGLSFMYHIR